MIQTSGEAEEKGSQVRTQPGQLSNLVKPCLTIKNEKGLRMWLRLKGWYSIPGPHTPKSQVGVKSGDLLLHRAPSPCCLSTLACLAFTRCCDSKQKLLLSLDSSVLGVTYLLPLMLPSGAYWFRSIMPTITEMLDLKPLSLVFPFCVLSFLSLFISLLLWCWGSNLGLHTR